VIALRLAEAGDDVAVLDMVPQHASECVAAIRATGRKGLGLVANVMDPDSLRRAIDEGAGELGGIEILVSNPGGTAARKFLDRSECSWRRHIDINLVSMVVATHAIAPPMIGAGRGGSIINVASIEASRAAQGFAVYGA
jgi:NAD(P)-dependent dehydrogenase (short-subunit alcohol dehydrogenase family)